jgi:hypothetical protein
MRGELWLVLFMVAAVKIPAIYLGVVIWRAMRQPPSPGEGDDGGGGLPVRELLTPPGRFRPTRRPPRGGRGGPERRPGPRTRIPERSGR